MSAEATTLGLSTPAFRNPLARLATFPGLCRVRTEAWARKLKPRLLSQTQGHTQPAGSRLWPCGMGKCMGARTGPRSVCLDSVCYSGSGPGSAPNQAPVLPSGRRCFIPILHNTCGGFHASNHFSSTSRLSHSSVQCRHYLGLLPGPTR